MIGLSATETMILSAVWQMVLTVVTLGVLWNARNRAVYFWCSSGVLGSVYIALSQGTHAEAIYPSLWGQYLLCVSVLGAGWMKVCAIGLLADAGRSLWPYLKAGLGLLAAIAVVPLLPMSRPWVSLFVVVALGVLMGIFVRDALRLGRRLGLKNSLFFAAAIGLQTVLISLLALTIGLTGIDPLLPSNANASVFSLLFTLTVSIVNAALFISLVLDINILERAKVSRRLTAIEVERSRLEERERLLADMHDGLGSQLATARIKVEQGAMAQDEIAQLLRECMADLHLLVDTLRDQDDSLATALTDYRYRLERRLADRNLALEWQIDLDETPRLAPPVLVQVLRVVQEAINNALKHAAAQRLQVIAEYAAGNGFSVRVEDDGRGIPESAGGGRGLANMQRRARELGGSLSVSRKAEGCGTVVELRFPVPSMVQDAPDGPLPA